MVNPVSQSVNLILHHLFSGIDLECFYVFENYIYSIFLRLVENEITTELNFLFQKWLLDVKDFGLLRNILRRANTLQKLILKIGLELL